MAKSLQSSLSNERISQLPAIKHRQQQTGGVINVPVNRDNKNFETREHQYRTFEDPNKSAMVDFDTHGIDNYHTTRKLVMVYNHNQRKDAYEVTYWKRTYLEQMELLNLCWRCHKPIKTRNSYITVSRTDSRDENGNPIALPSVTARRQKRSVSNPFWKFEFRTDQYRPSQRVTSGTYTDIQSHYEYKLGSDGKMFFIFVDGSNRNIQVRTKVIELRVSKLKFGKPRMKTIKRRVNYFVHVMADGETEIVPSLKYRVLNSKCACKVR